MSDISRSAPLVFHDGHFVPLAEARIAAVTGSSLNGQGVFTTIALVDGRPFEWHRHLTRLARDSSAIGLDPVPHEWDDLPARLAELADRNGHRNGKARITLLDSSPPALWVPVREPAVAVVVQTAEILPQPESLSLTVSPFPINSRSPLAGIKSCNYLEPILAAEDARRRGFDEAIRLNEEGKIVGCCLANLFWISRTGGGLRTPSERTGCLPGTMRGFVLDSVAAETVEMTLREFLDDAEAVFATSAVKGIRPAGVIEGNGGLGAVPDEILRLFPR